MKAIVCDQPFSLSMVDRAIPPRAAGELLLRARRVGVCGTDMHIFQGKHPYLAYPRVMGHEVSAEVVEADVDSRFVVGREVYLNPYVACGACIACRKGRPNCCVRIAVLGVHRDGALAEYFTVPERNAFPSDGLTLDQAAMLEFLAIGAHATRRSGAGSGTSVLIVGAGPIGLGTMIAALGRGAVVTVLDRRADRLRAAVDMLGLERFVVADADAPEALAALTDNEFFEVVIDATGNAASIQQGFAYVAHTGTYVLVSVVLDQISFADPEFHKREMSLLASRNATAEDFDEVMVAMRAGRVPVSSLLTHRARLDDLPDVFPRWIKPETGVIKAMVEL